MGGYECGDLGAQSSAASGLIPALVLDNLVPNLALASQGHQVKNKVCYQPNIQWVDREAGIAVVLEDLQFVVEEECRLIMKPDRPFRPDPIPEDQLTTVGAEPADGVIEQEQHSLRRRCHLADFQLPFSHKVLQGVTLLEIALLPVLEHHYQRVYDERDALRRQRWQGSEADYIPDDPDEVHKQASDGQRELRKAKAVMQLIIQTAGAASGALKPLDESTDVDYVYLTFNNREFVSIYADSFCADNDTRDRIGFSWFSILQDWHRIIYRETIGSMGGMVDASWDFAEPRDVDLKRDPHGFGVLSGTFVFLPWMVHQLNPFLSCCMDEIIIRQQHIVDFIRWYILAVLPDAELREQYIGIKGADGLYPIQSLLTLPDALLWTHTARYTNTELTALVPLNK
jgi:hypothetical protein